MPAAEPALLVSNRGYRYGDGVFETIKVSGGKLLLETFHFERLFSGLYLLQFDLPRLLSKEKLRDEILQLCRKNGAEQLARVRLSFFRGNGGLYDDDKAPRYIIECWPLNSSFNQLNENGLVIGVYPDAQKSCDRFSNLKSANFLPYSMAALYARANRMNDCLVLNANGHIADSTIANIFIIKDGVICTPSLGEGCVNGVMRRHLLASLQQAGEETREMAISISSLAEADEVFLSNAIRGISWVRQYGDSTYTNTKTEEIYKRFVTTIQG